MEAVAGTATGKMLNHVQLELRHLANLTMIATRTGTVVRSLIDAFHQAHNPLAVDPCAIDMSTSPQSAISTWANRHSTRDTDLKSRSID